MNTTSHNDSLELLAPAGGPDSLVAAIVNGADAVYFGVGKMNARASAENFAIETVRSAIDTCHESGVLAYAAVNTLLLNKELSEALQLVTKIYEYGIDALIVQDIGFASLIHRLLPDIPLHASTQMSIHNSDGVRMAQQLGLSRVVLARETSISDIKTISGSCTAELEVFVHGAMCVSVSGQCLHSSLLGGRSGNRGQCAQPCRMLHTLNGETGYLLSMKDLCLLEQVDLLRDADVTSLKIEGRMKKPQYVAASVRAFRQAIDGKVSSEQITEMKQKLACKYGRNGKVGTGYAFSRYDVIDTDDPSYLLTQSDSQEKPLLRKMELRGHFFAKKNEPIRLQLQCGSCNAEVKGSIPLIAVKKTLDNETVSKSLLKTGDTPFNFHELQYTIEDGLFVSAAELNQLRRHGIAEIQHTLIFQKRRIVPEIIPDNEPVKELVKNVNIRKTSITVQVISIEQAEAAVTSEADEIVIQPRKWDEQTLVRWSHFAREQSKPIWLSMPAIIFEESWKGLIRILGKLNTSAFKGVYVGNLGQILPMHALFAEVRGDYPLNINNGQTVRAFEKHNLTSLVMSPELNVMQFAELAAKSNRAELIVYGHLPTMHLAHCPRKRQTKSCKGCALEAMRMTDRKNKTFTCLPFQFQVNDCVWQILNAVPLDALKVPQLLKKTRADAWRLLFYEESAQLVNDRILAYANARAGIDAEPVANASTGHLKKGFLSVLPNNQKKVKN